MRTDKTTDKVEVAPFELKLPEPFDIKPDYEVELPAKHKALIFVVDVTRDRRQGGEYIPVQVKGWRIVVVNRRGDIPSNNSFRYDHTVTTELDVMRSLRELAQQLSKTKRTRVEQTDYDEE